MLIFGSEIIGFAGILRRKINLSLVCVSSPKPWQSSPGFFGPFTSRYRR